MHASKDLFPLVRCDWRVRYCTDGCLPLVREWNGPVISSWHHCPFQPLGLYSSFPHPPDKSIALYVKLCANFLLVCVRWEMHLIHQVKESRKRQMTREPSIHPSIHPSIPPTNIWDKSRLHPSLAGLVTRNTGRRDWLAY